MQDGNPFASEQKPSEAADATNHSEWMLRGTELHAAGQLEQALLAFENALALAPLDVNTASACATLLTLLDRPRAAYNTLLSVEALLLEDADGAANLAIAAEACGDLAKAQDAYAKALQIDPTHLRSLNNVAILAAASSHWEIATELARKCLELQPEQPAYHANLAEFLAGERRYPEALEVVTSAMAKFPHYPDLKIRHVALLAFNGALEKADAVLKGLDANDQGLFDEFLLKLAAADGSNGRAVTGSDTPLQPPDALDIHARQAFRNLSIGDWRNKDKLTSLLRQALEAGARNNQGRNWHDAPFYGLILDFREEELAQMRSESMAVMKASLKTSPPPFAPRRSTVARQKDSRIHVGLAVHSLRDERQLQALKRQLAQHDASRFALHVYAFTQPPEKQHSDALRPYAASVSELAHMLDAEAAGRMRLDHLDIYVEISADAPWPRPVIAAQRVAPVQLQQPAWHRHHVPGHWDYTVSDVFIHPDGAGTAPYGPIVRLPHTCWLANQEEVLAKGKGSREDAGLPADALVLCSLGPPATLDAESFSTWMKILRSLPDAVLWLPSCGKAASNLVREAQAAGVGATRLLFSQRMNRADTLAKLVHADLILDPMRFSTVAGLEDALRLGVPALSCAGETMAARLGASMLHAAGLPECAVNNPTAYIAEALRLGRNEDALRQLRERLQAKRSTAPLFDTPARIQEWEAAWTTMVERSRAGLAPAAFDVPSSSESVTPMPGLQP